MVTGSSVSAWKLLILVLSAQQNLQEAEAVADIKAEVERFLVLLALLCLVISPLWNAL